MGKQLNNPDLNQLNNVPAFIAKLYSILQDQKHKDLIDWDADGKSFGVKDLPQFAAKVLPNYFKHNNWQSFVRQLNMYGFSKLTDAFHLSSSNSWDFRHPFFQRDHPELFENIKRKASRLPNQDQKAKNVIVFENEMESKPHVQASSPNSTICNPTLETLMRRIEDLEQVVYDQSNTICNLQSHVFQLGKFQDNALEVISSLQTMLQETSEEEEERAIRRKKRARNVKRATQELANSKITFDSIYSGPRNSTEAHYPAEGERHSNTLTSSSSQDVLIPPNRFNLPPILSKPSYTRKQYHSNNYMPKSHHFDTSNSFSISTPPPTNGNNSNKSIQPHHNYERNDPRFDTDRRCIDHPPYHSVVGNKASNNSALSPYHYSHHHNDAYTRTSNSKTFNGQGTHHLSTNH